MFFEIHIALYIASSINEVAVYNLNLFKQKGTNYSGTVGRWLSAGNVGLSFKLNL